MAVTICAISDVALILAGIGGLGVVIHGIPAALIILKWVGVAYLCWYAIRSFRAAAHPEVLLPSEQPMRSLRSVVLMTLGFTFLNPHVYLDTVLLVGSIGNQYRPDQWWFAAGAGLSSILWFSALGLGSRSLAPLMSKPITWRVLDIVIGIVMLLITVKLLFSDLG